MSLSGSQSESRWPHALAVLLVVCTFPLIWVGGLVTTYDAGMAVPDWPSTYGYNLFLYPWTTWLAGPWDLMIEHGHRLLGALTGIVTLGFVYAVFRFDARKWMRYCALAALVLVVFQGGLGGARVLLDERRIALLHGCVGPAFFAFAAALAVMTSKGWQAVPRSVDPRAGRLLRLVVLTTVLAYVQLVIGAHLRHVPVGTSHTVFQATVLFHIVFGLAVAGHALALAGTIWCRHRPSGLRMPATWLALLVMAQLLLGAATWVVKYSWPGWLAETALTAGYTVQANSLMQSMTTTAHVATGSLILAVAVVLALRVFRSTRGSAGKTSATSGLMVGAAA